MTSGETKSPAPGSPLKRILLNAVWLVGGKGFGAVCSIIYLAILSRSLGLKGFGHFSLIFGMAQALVAIAGFQTWLAVARFGTQHIHEDRPDRFARLSALCGAVDAASAIIGCCVAGLVCYGFADALTLNPAYVDMAFFFSCALLWARVSAPTGMLRALDRYDAAVYVEAIVPSGRLVAAAAILWLGPTVGRFLLAWAVIDLVSALAYWITARRLSPAPLRFAGVLTDLAATREENPGIFRFLGTVSLSSTLDAATKQGPLLAVGWLFGTSAAGLYRMADQLAQGLSRASSLVTRAIYPEVTRASVAASAARFRRMIRRISLAAGSAGAVVVMLGLFAGQSILVLIGGEPFAQAGTILIPLAIAASLDLASVGFEPALHSTGNAKLSLAARLLQAVVLGFGIWLFLGSGPLGSAWAVAMGGVCGYLVMGAMALRTLRRLEREEHASTPG
jgi:O-antigen/teichoic acid export membrane protein